MNLLKNTAASCLFIVISTLIIPGCFKKDLEDFKKIDGVEYKGEWALPFIEKSFTLNDTVPTMPGFTTVRMSDTSDANIPPSNAQDTALSYLDNLDLRIRIENTFPISGVVQIYFRDSTDAVVDSLFDLTQRTIPLGNPTLIKYIDLSITKARYQEISNKSKKMFVFYDITTNNISGLSNKYMKVNIGLKAKFSTNL